MRMVLGLNVALLLLSGSSAAYAAAAEENAAVSTALEEVVVTATRREERLQDVPIAVTALTASALDSAAISGVRQLTVSVPGYNGGRNFIGLQPTMRGVGSSGVSIGDEPNVALYIDGVYQPSSHANTIDLVEVERVEALRGPQGTLFGRNATGGLINIITPDPSFDARGRVFGSYGRFRGAGNATVRGYVTGPLSKSFAADLAVLYRDSGGYIDDLVNGGKTGESDAINVRGKLLFQPSDRAKVVIAVAMNQNKDTAANAAQPVNGNTVGNNVPTAIKAREPFQVALSLPQKMSVRSWNAYVRTSFDFGAVGLETTSSFFTDKIVQQSDNDGSPVPAGQNRVDFHNDVLSQEVRLLSQHEGPLQWIAGVYGFHLGGGAQINSFTGVPPAYATINRTNIVPTAHVNAYAGFAEVNYALTDKLHVTVGGRYSSEKRDFAVVVNGAPVVARAEVKFDKWTYRGIVRYEFAERANVYASYSTGFKSGVFNTFSTSPLPVRPETIKSIEGGIKADPTSWLRTNLAVFHYDYRDLQVTGRVPNATTYLLLNAARAKVEGAELEIQGAFSPDFHLRLTASLLNAKYSSFPTAQAFVPAGLGGNVAVTQDVSGKRLLRAPRYTVSVGGDWGTDLGAGRLVFSGNVFRSARVYYDFANRLSQGAYTLVNGEVAWTSTDEAWRVSLYGTNLTNAKVFQQISTNSFADFGTYERPREVGLSAQRKF